MAPALPAIIFYPVEGGADRLPPPPVPPRGLGSGCAAVGLGSALLLLAVPACRAPTTGAASHVRWLTVFDWDPQRTHSFVNLLHMERVALASKKLRLYRRCFVAELEIWLRVHCIDRLCLELLTFAGLETLFALLLLGVEVPLRLLTLGRLHHFSVPLGLVVRAATADGLATGAIVG